MYDIDMEFIKGIFVVRLSGNFHENACDILENDLNQTITKMGIKYLLINLDDISFIDKKGIEVIFNNYLKLSRRNGKLIICGINKLFKYNVSITENLFQIPSEEEAFELINI